VHPCCRLLESDRSARTHALCPLQQQPDEADGEEDGEGGGLDAMAIDGGSLGRPAGGRTSDVAEQAAQGERQLQLWAQLGEQALHDLLLKLQSSQWTHLLSRDDVEGYITQVATPVGDGSANQRLDYCVKAETVFPMDPESVATAYLDVSNRHLWHTNCTESRLVEELWPGTMCIAAFTYRTELPVYPRGYCALVHRANHVLPDERVQIVIVDRSVAHPSVPPSRDVIFMDVFPSGMVITPVERHGEMHAHVALVAHFDLKGTISSQLLERVQANKMLESCCFKYLAEFRKHLTNPTATATAAPAAKQREAELASEGAATLIYAANSVGS